MEERKKVGLICDEGMITGFIMTGLISDKKDKNFFTVDKQTCEEDLENIFKDLISRQDIAIIFVADFVANKIKHVMDGYKEVVPTIMTIPTKEGNFSEEKKRK
ncbi:V-type ATPase, F subunit [Pseudoloma neurophilia]|uniref:V-type ATPase, F subunit n=1 Tax=Pseudoloma neurophilia TaxID=146866 RepID=A0A0R0M3W5_9MICR|nr:V-type ATPase, F subunit [Pseudoloma neurophilia]